MDSKSAPQTKFLRVSRFQSIKTKIIVFALLATIAPTLVLGTLSYLQNSHLLREKISHELRNATDQSSKALDLWLKERLYDLRVFSSSYIISENLPRTMGSKQSNIETIVTLDHIRGYLESVSEKFGVYEELTLLNLEGEMVVTSAEDPAIVTIPKPWIEQVHAAPSVGSRPRFQPYVGDRSILIAEGIIASDGALLGVLVAQIDLDAVRDMLKHQCVGGIDEIYLTDINDRLLVSSTPVDLFDPSQIDPSQKDSSRADQSIQDSPPKDRLQKDPSEAPTDYVSHHDKAVIGMAMPIATVGWTLVAEMDKEDAYAGIVNLRRITMALAGGLIFFIGLCAYIFGHTLVSPLRRLSHGASHVAGGDLDVDIPVTGLSEVSYLTQVFNHMVASLRLGREEISQVHDSLLETNEVLQKLSITDSLTGLYNRKHIMDLFGQEMARATRYRHSLAIMMIDIDYFKKINDTYGHQTGDIVVRQLAESLKGSVRECDSVGRYGGEEFLIVLPNSNIHSGVAMAERIRHNTGNLQIYVEGNSISVTISIGVAGYPHDGGDMESIIRNADNALYKAKAGGRNCVVVSEAKSLQDSPAESDANEPSLKPNLKPNLKLISRP